LRHFGARPVGAIERHAEVLPKLRPVRLEPGANLVEHLDRQSVGILRCLEQAWRHRVHQHGFRHARRSVPTDVAGNLAAAGRVSDVNRVLQVERCDERREIIGIRVHIVAGERLTRAPMSAPVVGDGAIPIGSEEVQLFVPRVGVERPPVAEDDGLTRSPILVKNCRAVFRVDRAHMASSSER
jgi:hypothetical protein